MDLLAVSLSSIHDLYSNLYLGQDKEQYNPTIARLLSHHQARATVRDVWVIDFPNHGETAILNRDTLDARKAASKGVCSAFLLLLQYTAMLII
jgi:hypothetical protein